MSRADYIHDRLLHSEDVELFTVNLFTVKLPNLIGMRKADDSWDDNLPESYIRVSPVDIFVNANGEAVQSAIVESNRKWTVQ